tara:strand:- start:137 stop:607 length:471 start_codon:yes stop_codon:yes gene_type:complete
MTKKSKTDKVWAYLVEHPLASTSEVAKATGTSYSYTYKLKSKIGTPKEVFEMEAMRQRLEEEEELPLRAQLLREAEEITCGARNIDYGDPVTNHRNIATIAGVATGWNIDEHDAVMVLIAAKIARIRISPDKRDHYVDLMAYAGIAYECAMARKVG